MFEEFKAAITQRISDTDYVYYQVRMDTNLHYSTYV